MLAVPVLRSRVAPVLNWCLKILIMPEDTRDTTLAEEVSIEGLESFELLRFLRARGVSTLICGALTTELLDYGLHLGLEIIYGVAGEVEEVLCAHRDKLLDQPHFRLPGCGGACRYRQGRAGTGFEQDAGGSAKKACIGRKKASQAVCICPGCGKEAGHQRGIPCSMVLCPLCERPMVKK